MKSNGRNGNDLGLGERASDFLAKQIGGWRFIIVQSGILLLWIVLNVILYDPYDPYPFILLNLALSFQAAFAGPIIMMAHNRQSVKDRRMARKDLELSVEAKEDLSAIARGLKDAGENFTRMQEQQMKFQRQQHEDNMRAMDQLSQISGSLSRRCDDILGDPSEDDYDEFVG